MITENRNDVDRDIEETLGLVPEFFRRVPDYLLPTEWASFKSLQLSDQTAIPNKYNLVAGKDASGFPVIPDDAIQILWSKAAEPLGKANRLYAGGGPEEPGDLLDYPLAHLDFHLAVACVALLDRKPQRKC